MMPHVLVVEDDPHNATLLRKLLEKRAGCRVTVTEDAAEVLRIVRVDAVDLVIMDVSLANSRLNGAPINGVELTRMIKSDPATAGVPVMLATAHAMRGDEIQLRAESGADDYVSKPIVDHASFVTQVGRWTERAA